MEFGSAHRLPFQRHIQRIIGELCHLIIIALVKADAFAAFNVNGRYYFDRGTPGRAIVGQLSALSFLTSEVSIRLLYTLTLTLSRQRERELTHSLVHSDPTG
jgi:hypothetical protein